MCEQRERFIIRRPVQPAPPAACGTSHSTGAAIVTGSDQPLTFGGRHSITLAPGAPALSDSINFDVPAVGDVVVSLYLPKASVPRTVHSLAVATTYISTPGDYSTAVVMPTARSAASLKYPGQVDAGKAMSCWHIQITL